ncbi:unnamed protein product [Amoebophrya sp. A25]|nr:unnamed protein product [Amoebophrya sp. A25]|eukprot:GSA25T00016534001.1
MSSTSTITTSHYPSCNKGGLPSEATGVDGGDDSRSFPFPVEAWNDIRFQDAAGRPFSRRDLFSYKKVLFFFAAGWDPISQHFAAQLIDHYNTVNTCRGEGALQVVLVSHDESSLAFARFFQPMPWLAVPYREVECASRLKLLFEVKEIPRLVAMDTLTMRIVCRNSRKRFGITADALDAYDELVALASGTVRAGSAQ